MDEKIFALMGAAAGVALAGRSLRPIAKVAVRGVVVAADTANAGLNGLAEIYSEVKAEQRGAAPAPAEST